MPVLIPYSIQLRQEKVTDVVMLDVKNIWLTEDELARCIEFSRISAPNQQAVEFGQHTTKPRSSCEIARDNLIGKIAEVAFSKMMKENYGIDIDLDFNYYPRGQWDNQDAVINGWRIDVKGTRRGGHWMLIEWNKLNFRQHNNNLSHVYLMFTVDWNRHTDLPTGRASYEGAVSLEKLRHGCPTTKILRKGEMIPGTKTRLQADNYGIHFKDLYKHLNHLVSFLTENQPPVSLTEKFCNPYSGKTTAELLATSHSINNINPTKQNAKKAQKSMFALFVERIRKIVRVKRS